MKCLVHETNLLLLGPWRTNRVGDLRSKILDRADQDRRVPEVQRHSWYCRNVKVQDIMAQTALQGATVEHKDFGSKVGQTHSHKHRMVYENGKHMTREGL